MPFLDIGSPSTVLVDLGKAAAGGVLIGASAGLLFWGNGRIVGISGFFAGLLDPRPATWREDLLFLIGLPVGLMAFQGLNGDVLIALSSSLPLLVAGGVLVGFGTRLGGGCTSGHGVCGLARLSKRSLVATLLFMGAAIATVALRSLP